VRGVASIRTSGTVGLLEMTEKSLESLAQPTGGSARCAPSEAS
jgi:hypothetical protein